MTAIQRAIVGHIGLDRLKASTDPYFNDIPLREWDALAVSVFRNPCSSLGQRVSILKDAARSLIGGKPIVN